MSGPMTVEEAAQIYERSKPIVAAHGPRLEQAEKVLKVWFEQNPDYDNYNLRIRLTLGQRAQLDQDAVKAELGERLPAFMRPMTIRGLSLIPEIMRDVTPSSSSSSSSSSTTGITCIVCNDGLLGVGIDDEQLRRFLAAQGWLLSAGGPRCFGCRGR